MKDNVITMAHGAGGRKMQEFISAIIKKYFSNPILDRMDDSALLTATKGRLVFTTDSFVVTPVFFSGGDIGRLAVCGTVNDLTAMGAKPLYITAALIIEEGFPVLDLEKILASMKRTAVEAGVVIAAGDTKVVERGKADKIFINTAGIGAVYGGKTKISSVNARPGDVVILTGNLGDHEIAILKERENLKMRTSISSDCAPLFRMIKPLLDAKIDLHVMRDPTRGGLAAVLNEISFASGVDIKIFQDAIPLNRAVKTACSMLGFDPLFLANEGKMVIFCGSKHAEKALKLLKKSPQGIFAAIIGSVTGKNKKPLVTMQTTSGGERIVLMPEGEQLPRIC